MTPVSAQWPSPPFVPFVPVPAILLRGPVTSGATSSATRCMSPWSEPSEAKGAMEEEEAEETEEAEGAEGAEGAHCAEGLEEAAAQSTSSCPPIVRAVSAITCALLSASAQPSCCSMRSAGPWLAPSRQSSSKSDSRLSSAHRWHCDRTAARSPPGLPPGAPPSGPPGASTDEENNRNSRTQSTSDASSGGDIDDAHGCAAAAAAVEEAEAAEREAEPEDEERDWIAPVSCRGTLAKVSSRRSSVERRRRRTS